MSVLEVSNERLDAWSDRFNPILVKETRQALKSRQFVAMFLLVLLACWLICTIGVVMAGSQIQYGSPAASFLTAIFSALSFAVVIAIPFSTYRSLLSEQDSQTYELLNITALSPGQIIRGKLLNSVVQILVLYSAVTPFVAFTSLLQGFDLQRVAVLMLSLLLLSVFLCMGTLMLSTISRNRQIQVLSTLFILGGLLVSYSSLIGFMMGINQFQTALDGDFWWSYLVFSLVGLSYFLLFFAISVCQLRPETANRSTPIRIVATAQFLLGWVLLWGYMAFRGIGMDLDSIQGGLVYSLVHWSLFGLFVSMERDTISRRVRRGIPRWGLLRLMSIPFFPGGTRGYLLVLLNLSLLWGLVLIFQPIVAGARSYGVIPPAAIHGVIAYIVIYLGLGCLLTRWLLRTSAELQPIHGWTVLIVLFAGGCIVPYLLLWAMGHFENYNYGYHLLQITNPFETLSELGDNSTQESTILTALAAAAALMMALNLRAFVRATKEILYPQRDQPTLQSGVLSEASAVPQ